MGQEPVPGSVRCGWRESWGRPRARGRTEGGEAALGRGRWGLSFPSLPDTMRTSTQDSWRLGMEIAVRQRDAFTIVAVEGKLVRENQGELRAKLEELVDKGAKGIALDFAGVNYLDSAGLGCCASVQKLMQDRGSGALVMFGAPSNVEKTWRLIRLDLVIPVFPTEKEAVTRLRSEAPTSGF